METHSTIKKRQDDRYVRTSEHDPQEYERAQRPQPTTPEGAEEEVEVPRKEKALIEVHPAMFGNHPATYLFYWALVVGGIIGAAMFWMAGAVFSGTLCLIATAWGGCSWPPGGFVCSSVCCVLPRSGRCSAKGFSLRQPTRCSTTTCVTFRWIKPSSSGSSGSAISRFPVPDRTTWKLMFAEFHDQKKLCS